MVESLLENRDYTVIVAKTAASVLPTSPGFVNSWVAAHDAVMALVKKCEELDPDGITLYLSSRHDSSGSFKQYKKVTPDKLEQLLEANYPPETLNLLDGLQTALDDYFDRKAAGQTKPNGEIIIVLIDGEPSDRMAIVRAIVQATQKMERDEELGIGIAQIGNDLIARGFLASLDEDLRSRAGAKFDIVNTRVLETIGEQCLTEFLLDVIRH
ncbi:MAG: hypothetical protein ACAF41_16260 [Leptolyngbya sp. BL-A-14]